MLWIYGWTDLMVKTMVDLLLLHPLYFVSSSFPVHFRKYPCEKNIWTVNLNMKQGSKIGKIGNFHIFGTKLQKSRNLKNIWSKNLYSL